MSDGRPLLRHWKAYQEESLDRKEELRWLKLWE